MKIDLKKKTKLKRFYKIFKDILYVKEGSKWRPCESITEFLNLKWVNKSYHKIGKLKSEKFFLKKENRKKRYNNKKVINEGLKEHEECQIRTCSSCNFYDEFECTFHKIKVDPLQVKCEHYND